MLWWLDMLSLWELFPKSKVPKCQSLFDFACQRPLKHRQPMLPVWKISRKQHQAAHNSCQSHGVWNLLITVSLVTIFPGHFFQTQQMEQQETSKETIDLQHKWWRLVALQQLYAEFLAVISVVQVASVQVAKGQWKAFLICLPRMNFRSSGDRIGPKNPRGGKNQVDSHGHLVLWKWCSYRFSMQNTAPFLEGTALHLKKFDRDFQCSLIRKLPCWTQSGKSHSRFPAIYMKLQLFQHVSTHLTMESWFE